MTNLHEASDMSATLRESDLSIRRFRGASYGEALAAAQAELGDDIRVIGADKIRRGGLGGFFATDLGVEVAVAPGAGDVGASRRLRDHDAATPPSVSDADWEELMRRVEADDLRARGPVARRVGVDRLLEDAERADRELSSWATDDDLDVPDFLQHASSLAAGRPVADEAFGIDVSPAGLDLFAAATTATANAADAAPAPTAAPDAFAERQRIADGGDGGRRLLDDVLAAALADELPIPPAPVPSRAELEADSATSGPATPEATTFDLFSDITDYEPVDSPPPAAAPTVVSVPPPPPPPTVEAATPSSDLAPRALDPLRRPTELATIAAGRLAMALAELPSFGGGRHAEAYRVSVAVTTPDGTRIEMSTEVDGSDD